MRFGFEAYSWQSAGVHYIGRLDHVIDVASECRIPGIEAEVCMLGPYASEPTMLRAALDSREMSLASVCYVEDWRGRGESDGERARADWVIDYLDHFPGTLLQLCPRSGSDRKDLRERQQNAIRCMNNVARRAADKGLACTVHPSSPAGSVFRTADDYGVLLGGIDSAVIGFTPDTGNILRGRMDPLEVIRTYRSQIRLVHIKDISAAGDGAALGQGIIGLPAIVSFLAETGFDGWAIVDDESPLAHSDPDEAAHRDAAYVHGTLSLGLG